MSSVGMQFPRPFPAPLKTWKSRRFPGGFSRFPESLKRSEPLRAPPSAVLFTVALAVHAPLPGAVAPTLTAMQMGQHLEPTLLAVIQGLVERIGRIGDLLQGRRRSCHVVGTLAQAGDRIFLLLAIVFPRLHPRVGAVEPDLDEISHRGFDRRAPL